MIGAMREREISESPSKRVNSRPISYRLVAAALVTALVAAAAGVIAAALAPIKLESGSYDGVRWTLSAQDEWARFCMSLKTTPARMQQDSGQQCGFNHEFSPGSGYNTYYYGGNGAPGPYVLFGPVPSNATRVQVATHLSVATRDLPARPWLARGRYWMFIEPATLPQKDGTYLDAPRALDGHGRTVSFEAFN